MSFLRRLWGYIKTLFRVKAEAAMDPEIEIEQAINEAKKRDQELRNQAAKVIAHRTQLEQKLESAADTLGVALQLEDRFPSTSYQVIELGRLALEFGASPLPPLPPMASEVVAVASSYHVTLFCALLGIPCHLLAANEFMFFTSVFVPSS